MAEGGAKGSKWTREETLAALSLYCQIPFGQMRHENPRVIALARRLGRTPGAVAMKLGNLASFDPFHQARSVGGLKNASAMDKAVWDEFYGRWDTLAAVADADELVEADDLATERGIAQSRDTTAPDPSSTSAVALVTVRRGQRFFRNAVLSAYGAKCCVTGIEEPQLLRASHIVPWAEREETRLDPANGLCLNALHDAAFDRGLITVGEDWTLRVSGRVRGVMPEETWRGFFQRFDGAKVDKPERWEPAGEFLEWHRGRVFGG